MKAAIAFLTLLIAAPFAFGQSLPDKPKPQVSITVAMPNHIGIERMTLDVPHRTADPAWIAAQSMMISATAADAGLALAAPGREANPIWHHPAIGIAINAAVIGTVSYLSWKWKREDDAARANGILPASGKWYYLHIAATAPHIAGIAISAARR